MKIVGYIRTLHDRINYRGMVEQQISGMNRINKFKIRSFSFQQFYPFDEWDCNWWTADDWRLDLKPFND